MDETYAYFTIDGLGKSAVVTELLGLMPDDEFSEGDPRKRVGIHKTMKWMLYSRLPKEGSLHETMEQHVIDVLSRVEEFKEKLVLLSDEYKPYIQCVAYYHGAQLGFGLSKNTLERASALGLGIDFDIYSLPDENENA